MFTVRNSIALFSVNGFIPLIVWNNEMYWCQYYNIKLFVSARQRSSGKVMFSYVSVHQPFCPGGVPMKPLPIIHWTSWYRASPPRHQTWDPSYLAQLLASDIWWLSLETCSNLFTWRPTYPHSSHTHQYSHLVVTEAHTAGKGAVHTLQVCFKLFV